MEDKQIELLHTSWNQFKDGDLVENGAQMYFRLFSKYPTAKALFSFNEGDDELTPENFRQNARFCEHLKKIWDTLGSVVSGLNDVMDLAALVPTLKELGERHHTRGISKYFDALGECLLYALELKLGSNFTPDVKNSWIALYSVIEVNMKGGMARQAKKELQAQQS